MEHEQARRVVKLAITKQHRTDARVAHSSSGLHGVESVKLRANVRRGVAENPVLAVLNDGRNTW